MCWRAEPKQPNLCHYNNTSTFKCVLISFSVTTGPPAHGLFQEIQPLTLFNLNFNITIKGVSIESQKKLRLANLCIYKLHYIFAFLFCSWCILTIQEFELLGSNYK